NRDPGIHAAEIRRLSAEGGTSIYPALEQACAALEKLPPAEASSKHILLMTDGVSEWGNYDALLARMAKAHITLSTVAVGADADAPLLSQLALRGCGNSYNVSDAARLRETFVREATALRRPYILEPPDGISLLSGESHASLPPLRGMVLTSPRTAPGAQIPLMAAGGEHDVVLTHWLCGMGRAAVFAGDATPRWAAAWVAAPCFSKFWAQTVRSVARRPMSDDFEIRTIRDGAKTRLIVEAYDQGRAWSFLSIDGRCTTPDAHAQARELKLAQTGPGTYETTLDTADPGAYFIAMHVQGPGGERGSLRAGTIVAAARELRELKSNDALLKQIAADTGGRVL